jgi:Ca2+-transporting ATPase
VEERAPGESLSIVDFVEPLVILVILILNAIVGVWQESNAESALEALKEMQSDTARCLRDGEWDHEFLARDLVPGDLVELRTGDRVPADCRAFRLKTATIRLEQASLTGESVAVNKILDAVADEGCELQAKECMLFGGTAVSQGSCVAIVTDIGMSTEIGKIQAQIQAAAQVGINGVGWYRYTQRMFRSTQIMRPFYDRCDLKCNATLHRRRRRTRR